MSALIAILLALGLVGQDDVQTITKQEVDKVVKANYTKVHQIGSQEMTSGWDGGDIEDDNIGGD